MPVTPYKDSSLNKKQQVARMFNNIAWRYDFLNHFLSFGIDHYWRQQAINELKKSHPQLILDVATGTGDLAITALQLNPKKVFGVDISSDMLEIGRKKLLKKNLQNKIELLEVDSEKLIFEDNKFDAITVGFGVRNFENLEKGLSEMRRVLKPGGTLVVLEFSQPKSAVLRGLYTFYSTKVTPFLGKLISKDKAAYTYLHESVSAFPFGKDFTNILEKTGYQNTNIRPLTFGIATVYTAEK
ncbi:MAG: bifunctional demethylmenaquinone methyltransferase/2-methoxy-6-polyprenyl-1,4-benzoquinol methylase UbiE [Bacteroidia bacterium]|nr:bifunctional demethylmenaquinone methyltransferase/2-methoxy-6-polyprenyl-1,4-benzoquinol methylase UbiE [Bacteroidia bacterium]MBP6650258.1 bifunctional demethylmenaquinone methyltransferase/2-methoxy-6-polyprenyl-1,4-benzoquinol methylase UbiE [Bacteroidia bacterium]